jgi:pilus assembly protein CpaF
VSTDVRTLSSVDDDLVAALCRAAEREPGDATSVVRAHVRRVAPLAGADVTEELVRAAVARLDGLGELDALLRDETIDEVLVNSSGEVWIERDGDLQPVGHLAADDLAVVVERILAPLGRRVDRSSPVVDARLPDGSRVCAVVPPVAVDGACLAVRRFHDRALPLHAFCDDAVARFVEELVARRCNVIVSGATSSGKTSLLNSTLALAPLRERLVIIEDTAELLPRVAHLVRLEARPATPDGPLAITLEQLVRTALRLRPDRLIVGEVRGPEVVALVQALNTGHDGSWSTCHANGALDALHRLETLVVQAAPAWPLRAVRDHLVRCIDVVVHVERTVGGTRRVVEIAEVIDRDGAPATRPLVIGDERVGQLCRSRAGWR